MRRQYAHNIYLLNVACKCTTTEIIEYIEYVGFVLRICIVVFAKKKKKKIANKYKDTHGQPHY